MYNRRIFNCIIFSGNYLSINRWHGNSETVNIYWWMASGLTSCLYPLNFERLAPIPSLSYARLLRPTEFAWGTTQNRVGDERGGWMHIVIVNMCAGNTLARVRVNQCSPNSSLRDSIMQKYVLDDPARCCRLTELITFWILSSASRIRERDHRDSFSTIT